MPLSGIRVVTLEQAVAGPFCSRQLADHGAEVIKIERPDGGDSARAYDNVLNGTSAYFAWLNRGKQSVVLDLKQDGDRDAGEDLRKSFHAAFASRQRKRRRTAPAIDIAGPAIPPGSSSRIEIS